MAAKSNQVRIIAGQWRGRKLEFPDSRGLRPTADRVRETLFNWLAPVLPGARCLDLFAGSGALGFEAASRAAASVVMVEQDRGVFGQLRRQVAKLSADSVELVNADALGYLATACSPFDIVFLDPPFDCHGLLQEAVSALNTRRLVRPGGLIYLETGRGEGAPELPAHWQPYRHKQAGQVNYQLLIYAAEQSQES